MRSFKILTCLILVLCGCSTKDNKQSKTQRHANFTTFEISYTNGWLGDFAFIVDSDKIYFSPAYEDLIYGTLPDSVFNIFNDSFFNIVSDTAIRSTKEIGGFDVNEVAIKVITENDTIRIHQKDKINKELRPIIEFVKDFLTKTKHKHIKAWPVLETFEMIYERPSPRFLELQKNKFYENE